MANAKDTKAYKDAHSDILSATVQRLKKARGQEQVAVFSGAAAALFELMFEGHRFQGVPADEAAAKTQGWWAAYGAHLAQQNAVRPAEPAND